MSFGTSAGNYRQENKYFVNAMSPVLMLTADLGLIIKDLSGQRIYGLQYIFQTAGHSEINVGSQSIGLTFADADNMTITDILSLLAANLDETWSFATIKLEAEAVSVPDSGTAFEGQSGEITLSGYTTSGPANITGEIVTDTSTINSSTSSGTAISLGASLMQNPADALFKIYKQLDDGPGYHNISTGWTISGGGSYGIGVHLDANHVIIISSEAGDAISGGGSFSDKGSGSINSSTSSGSTYFTIDKSKNPAGFLADLKSLYQAQDGAATDKWSYAILKVTSVS